MPRNCIDKHQNNNDLSLGGGIMNDFYLLICTCLNFAAFSTVAIRNFHNLSQ